MDDTSRCHTADGSVLGWHTSWVQLGADIDGEAADFLAAIAVGTVADDRSYDCGDNDGNGPLRSRVRHCGCMIWFPLALQDEHK